MTSPAIQVYHCPLGPQASAGYIPLSSRDAHAMKIHAPVTLGYSFKAYLEPDELCQSLSVILTKLPQFSGQLVAAGAQHYIATGVYQAEVKAVAVADQDVHNPAAWPHILDHNPMRPPGHGGLRLFQALLLRGLDPAAGCALLVSFDHGIADATTCSAVMSMWSKVHARAFPALASPGKGMLPPADHAVACTKAGLQIRRVQFHPQQLAALKGQINQQAPPHAHVSTNDLLMAICAVVLAPHTAQRSRCRLPRAGRGFKVGEGRDGQWGVLVFGKWPRHCPEPAGSDVNGACQHERQASKAGDVLSVRPTGRGWGGWVGRYGGRKNFVYLKWASHFWLSIHNFIFPPRTFFFGFGRVSGLARPPDQPPPPPPAPCG